MLDTFDEDLLEQFPL